VNAFKDRLISIEYGSEAYNQAAQLRYQLFYQEHSIPFESIFDPQEARDLHLAIIANLDDQLLAYGRLGQNHDQAFQIYQMVVRPDYQRRGLGRRLIQALIAAAIEHGAQAVVLNARVAKIQFYQKNGFKPVGEICASSMTGVPHIKMQKETIYHRDRPSPAWQAVLDT
jgi:predicted GNAT family N-acyltransferase